MQRYLKSSVLLRKVTTHSKLMERNMITITKSSSNPSIYQSEIPSLLSAQRAVALVNEPNIKFLDGSWHLNKARLATDEFLKERIPKSQYINIDAVSDQTSSLPHMIPTAEYFSECVENLGVSSADHVVIYSTHEAFSMPRVWWMFKLFGHNKVSILNGGLPAWKAAGGEIETGPPSTPQKGSFQAKLNPKLFVTWEDVLKVVNDGSAQILDARSTARFNAEVPEPRPGLPGGHIPGSLSMPFTSIVKSDDVTTFKAKEDIHREFTEAGYVFGSKAILSCGSGVSAAVLAFALDQVGKNLETCPIYDGSWTEWASREGLPRIP